MKRLLSIPLRVLLPVLLLSCAATAGLISWKLNTRMLEAEVESQFLDEARLHVTGLQATLEYLFRKGDDNGVSLQVSGTATRKDVIAAFVLNRQDRILAATSWAAIGNAAGAIEAHLPEDLRSAHVAQLTRVRASPSGSMVLSQDRRVAVAYYPLLVDISDHALRSTKNGVLVVVLDMQITKDRAFRAADRQAFDNALLFGGLAAGAWVFIHFSLTRRVAGLVATTRQLASGDLTARTRIEGNDELAKVATAVDSMADRIVEDMLRRGREEEKLRESESRFRNVFNLQFQLIAILSPEGRILNINDLPLRLGEVTREEVMGQFFWETTFFRHLPTMRAAWPGRLEAAARTEGAVLSEDQFNVASIEVHFADIALTAVKNASGKLECFIVQGNDTTERKRDESALRESDEKFQQLADNITDVFWIRSPDLREIHYISPAFEKIWGRSVQSLYADPQKWSNCIFPEDRERVLADFAEFTGEARNLEIEHRIVRPDGEIRWVRVRGFQVRDAAGALIRHTGIVTDITDRKHAEADLERTHGRLLETSRQAGMAEVATGVLHNVGNVLNSVNVSATLVSESVKRSKVSSLGRVVALMDQHAADLGAFVTSDSQGRNLLEFLRQLHQRLVAEQQTVLIETEALRQSVEHINDIVSMQQEYAKVSGVTEVLKVTELVEDSLRMNAAALARHGVTVERDFQEVPPITIEKHKTLQILVNLISNAKYACDEGGRTDKRVTLQVRNGDGHIKISVCDNGVGIPAENLDRIFNHGFTTRKEGHGFGLHCGALAAAEMGGTLRVHSDGPGHGATFTLELPVTASK